MSRPFDSTRASPDSLRVVLFGPPGAGKTTLTAALDEAEEKLPAAPIFIDAADDVADQELPADALVLLLDGGSSPEQLDDWFESFGNFVRALEAQRGRRLEARGLPVFLVLTKCDLIARPDDTPMDWMEHIEERKREVDERFRAYLARDSEEEPPAFGGVEVHCWATAAQRPALSGAKPSRESYGIAELYRQCVEQGTAYRGRQRRAAVRLRAVASTAVALVLMLAGLTVYQFFHGGRSRSTLELQVENLHFSDREKAADRLNAPEKELTLRAGRLQRVADDPGFGSLPSEEQNFVVDRLDEVNQYRALMAKIPLPRALMELRTLSALRKLRDDVKQLSPRPEWADTDAIRRRAERLADLDALEDAVLAVQGRFRTDTDRAATLLDFKDLGPGPAWLDETRRLMATDRNAGLVLVDHIPGSTVLTYGTALAFDDVAGDRQAWEKQRGNLTAVRNLVAALGLGGPGIDPPPALAFPEGFTLEQARERAAQLKKNYPHAGADFSLDALPSAIRKQVIGEARRSWENLLHPARALTAQKGAASEDWDHVRSWLRAPRELDDWRVLARALSPLLGGPPRDPVEELDAFLKQRSFPLRAVRLVLEIPENSVPRLRPPATAVLNLEYTPPGGEKTTVAYNLDNTKTEVDRDNRVTRYVFNRTMDRDLYYEPKGELTVTVPAVDNRRLTWKDPRASKVYQIERLVLPPLQHRESQPATEGTSEPGVRLLCVEPADGLPRWPDLLQKNGR